MYDVKLVKHDGSVELLGACIGVNLRPVAEGSAVVKSGIDKPGGYLDMPGGRTVHIPTDGRDVFVTNQAGETLARISMVEGGVMVDRHFVKLTAHA